MVDAYGRIDVRAGGTSGRHIHYVLRHAISRVYHLLGISEMKEQINGNATTAEVSVFVIKISINEKNNTFGRNTKKQSRIIPKIYMGYDNCNVYAGLISQIFVLIW